MLASLLFLPLVTALYSSKDAVLDLSPKQWDDQVKNSKCGHCKALAPEYKKAAQKLKGLAKVVAVDCDQHNAFCGQFGVRGFPTIKIFFSDKKKPPLDYQGARTAAAIVNNVIPKIATFVEKVKSVDEFLDKSESPKVVLFSKKTATPPLFKALSVEYENCIQFGEVASSQTEIVSQFNVSEFPSVVIFAKGSKEAVPYKGAMKHAGLVEVLDKHCDKPRSKGSNGSKKEEAPKEPAKVHKIASQEELEKVCANLCLISFWAHEPEFKESEEQHQQNLKILEAVKGYKSVTFGWVNSVEHGKQLMKDADVSDMLPAMVAINSKRGWFRNFRNAYTEEGIKSFVDDILKGRGRSFKMNFDLTLDKPAKKPEEKKPSNKKEKDEL